jgi:copper(I)-binding protein
MYDMKTLLLLAALLFPLSAFAQDETKLPASALYAFETSAGMKVGAAFGILHGGEVDDELLSVTSPISPRIEIHEMKEVNGIMQMRQVASMPIEKNKDNALSANGYHLMLMDLAAPLQKGQEFPVTLMFKKAGAKTLTVPVMSRKVQ